MVEAVETSYRDLLRWLTHYLDEVVDDQEEVVVRRRGGRDVVLVDALEYASMRETLHVLTPIENARRLIEVGSWTWWRWLAVTRSPEKVSRNG